MSASIPSLGNTALEVYNAALKIETAGYQLRFESVFDGAFIYDYQQNVIRQEKFIGRVPVVGQIINDSFIIDLISCGEVGIFIKGPGFSKEYHRARGIKIPKGEID